MGFKDCHLLQRKAHLEGVLDGYKSDIKEEEEKIDSIDAQVKRLNDETNRLRHR